MPDPTPRVIEGEPVAVTKTDILREWFGGERYARDYEYIDANFGKEASRVAALYPTAPDLWGELERVTRERDEAIAAHKKSTHEAVRRIEALGRDKSKIETQLLTLEAENAALKAALEPFAKYMDGGHDLNNKGAQLPDERGVGWVYLTFADFRAARAAYRAALQKDQGHDNYRELARAAIAAYEAERETGWRAGMYEAARLIDVDAAEAEANQVSVHPQMLKALAGHIRIRADLAAAPSPEQETRTP